MSELYEILEKRVDTPDLKDVYTADFETTGVKNYERDGRVRVFLWSLTNIKTKECWVGYCIDSFLVKLQELGAKRVYFHNLNFDGDFILYHLLEKGMNHCVDILAPDAQLMEIKYSPDGEYRVDFRCSYLKAMMGVKNLGIMLSDELDGVGKLDPKGSGGVELWNKYLPIDYVPDNDFIEYCKQDSYITAVFMEKEYMAERTRLTPAGEAWRSLEDFVNKDFYKRGYGRFSTFSPFKQLYPQLPHDEDAFVRGAYRGGICLLNPKFTGKVLKDVYVLDVKSMYPSVMTSCELPVGRGKLVDYKPGGLYVVHFTAEFKVKDNYPPTIQLKNSSRFGEAEYISDSQGVLDLKMTNICYEQFKEHYDVKSEYGHRYMSFKHQRVEDSDLADFIMEQMTERAKYSKKENPYMNKVYKDQANMTYGAFALSPVYKKTKPVLKNGILTLLREIEYGDGRYVACATFITAYARQRMLKAIADNYENFIYCDTDSIHLTQPPVGLDMGNKLGQWEMDGAGPDNIYPVPTAKYLRDKAYIFADENEQVYKWWDVYDNEQTSITCSGMNDKIKSGVTFEEFVLNKPMEGKLRVKRVKGGRLLEEGEFTIHDNTCS